MAGVNKHYTNTKHQIFLSMPVRILPIVAKTPNFRMSYAPCTHCATTPSKSPSVQTGKQVGLAQIPGCTDRITGWCTHFPWCTDRKRGMRANCIRAHTIPR